jgi:hypothetical protein
VSVGLHPLKKTNDNCIPDRESNDGPECEPIDDVPSYISASVHIGYCRISGRKAVRRRL